MCIAIFGLSLSPTPPKISPEMRRNAPMGNENDGIFLKLMRKSKLVLTISGFFLFNVFLLVFLWLAFLFVCKCFDKKKIPYLLCVLSTN